MQANEWVAFGGGIIGGVIGLAVIVGFLYRRIIHPLNSLIHKELSPNGGTSIKDTVNRLERKVDSTIALQLDMDVELRRHMRDTAAHYQKEEDDRTAG